MDNANQPRLLLPDEYIKTATELVRQATTRIYIISLCLVRCPATDQLIDELINASRRGVEVNIAADLLTFIWNPKAIFGKKVYRPDQVRKELHQAGAKFRWLGLGRVPYLFGRTHSKWMIIDDNIFSFGGVNLDQSGITERADYIFHIHDKDMADKLAVLHRTIEKSDTTHRQLSDYTIKTQYGTILIDNGRIRRSVIYQHAVKLAREAQKILVVTQYCPTGELDQLLTSKNASVYFNPKGSAADAINNILIGKKDKLAKRRNLYKRKKYLHAKFIIATLPNGDKRAITGSHNFSTFSIKAGTREIALETTDQRIISQLEQFYLKHIK